MSELLTVHLNPVQGNCWSARCPLLFIRADFEFRGRSSQTVSLATHPLQNIYESIYSFVKTSSGSYTRTSKKAKSKKISEVVKSHEAILDEPDLMALLDLVRACEQQRMYIPDLNG